MKIMAKHSSASMRDETPHTTKSNKTIINNSVKRRAQAVINDRSIEAQTRGIIRYGLETNDPWLPDLLRGLEAGESIEDTIKSLANAEDQLA